MKKIAKVMSVLVILMLVFTMAACEQEGPAEQAGEEIDEAVEEAGDQMEEAGDTLEEAAEDIEKKAEETVQ